MSISWYLCKNCSTLIKKDSSPSSFDCPKGGHHSWNNLGKVGSTNYQCSQCGTTIQVDSTPSSFDCPSGGHHRWNKL